MGNSASNANNPPGRNTTNTIRTTSTSPGPGNPHRSMRTKKRSLELPDLASLSLTPTSGGAHAAANRGRPSKTASIPIPATPPNPFNHYQQANQVEPERAPVHLPSTTDMLEQHLLQPPSTHQPFPPPSSRGRPGHSQQQTTNQSAPKGRQQPISARQSHQQQRVMHIQELYDRSQHPAAPPSSPAGPSSLASPGGLGRGFTPEVVRSSIPVTLGKARLADAIGEEVPSPFQEDLLADPVPVKIVWRGGGREVVLARAGDDEWKGRQPMERDSVNANVWTLTVMLQPGTHHVRFLVDGQWRVADDLPAAVDDQGSLANYVAVPLTYGLPGATQPAQMNAIQVSPPPPPPPPQRKLVPGQSFWSADSSADGETDDSSSAPIASASRPAPGHATKPSGDHYTKNAKEAAAAAYVAAKWTSVFPPELLEAAREEEAYLAASAGQYDLPTGNTRVTGFVPAPNIPPAPGLPRHLDKLILNSRVGEQRSAPRGEGSGNGGSVAGGVAAGATGGVGATGIGSGQGGSGARDRRGERADRDRDRERDRDRDRDRNRDRERERERGTRSSRRPNVPPPPPPSEDGTGDYEPPVLLPPPVLPPAAQAVPATSSSLPSGGSALPAASTLASTSAGTLTVGSSGVDSIGSSSSKENGSASGTTTAATSPQGSLPATPTGPLSPTQSPPIGAIMGPPGSGSGLGLSSLPPGTILPTSGISSTAPNYNVNANAPGNASPTITAADQRPQPPPLERAPISGSRAITIDTDNMPALTDDGSVLPVPSHVVLHHLCTSAIRNGVLAVANTTRYRKKYLTTIYYKPT